VTSDVQEFLEGTETNFGWIIKKEKKNQNGAIDFSSKEASDTFPKLALILN